MKGQREVIVIGAARSSSFGGRWGRGALSDEALREYKKAGGSMKNYAMFDVPPGTTVDGMGGFSYDSEHIGAPPVLLRQVVKGKVKEEK